MQNVDIDKEQIYLGWMTEDQEYKDLVVCASMPNKKLINLETLDIYPQMNYSVVNGIIMCPKLNITKMIKLSPLLSIFGYQKIKLNQISEVLSYLQTDYILNLWNEKKRMSETDIEEVKYLQQLYYLIQNNEFKKEKKGKKQCQYKKKQKIKEFM